MTRGSGVAGSHHAVHLCAHVVVDVVLKLEVSRAVDILDVGTHGGAVDMSLHDMAVEAAAEFHRALQIHQVARLQVAQVRAVESLLYGGDLVGAVGVEGHHGQAHTVVSHRLVYAQLVGK